MMSTLLFWRFHIDILHEEIIRLELMCLDTNRLKKNAETSRMERDPEVFTQASRWLGYFGEKFVKSSEHDPATRKYEKYYKQVLAVRSHLRKSGFLGDYTNLRQPFYSSDLKTEMHTNLHNYKLWGEENFTTALDHLSSDKSYTTLPCRVQPKTLDEEEKILKRNELSKEELHKQAIINIKKALENHSEDAFLLENIESLEKKKPQSFNPKSVLSELCSKIEQYIENIVITTHISDLVCDNGDNFDSVCDDGDNSDVVCDDFDNFDDAVCDDGDNFVE